MRFVALLLPALALLGSVPRAEAQPPCTPRETPRIAVCNSSCNQNFCGYDLIFAGKRFVGNFITYHTRGDNKPIEIPDGQTQAEHAFRVQIPTVGASIHMYLDEIPDLSLYIIIKQENGPFEKEFRSEENEYMKVDDLVPGYYRIRVIKRSSSPGGNTANYVPTIWVVPSVQADGSRDSKESAKNVGELSATRPIEVQEALQAVAKRLRNGNISSEYEIDDRIDWFRFTTSGSGLIKAKLKKTAVLDSEMMTQAARVDYANSMTPFPIDIPINGLAIGAGTHFIRVSAPAQANEDYEFGLNYELSVTFQPR